MRLANQGGQVEAGERHLQHRVDAAGGVLGDRVLGNGEDDHGDRGIRVTNRLRDVETADATLQERVDDHDVRPHVRNGGDCPLTARDDVEHLDLGLGIEQRPHVRRHLRHVLDHQQPDLFPCHSLPLATAWSMPRGSLAPSFVTPHRDHDPTVTLPGKGLEVV